ncbi:tumor necrosis factor alpha-induced protein 2a [Larimichthys crocea]|uniref:tumor necrosis factor alpha-induced protein 2a n=1 Tax=Larimichthys crocea TaxID=215358 RepID=UPI0009018476|nr:tumor necrosis factor alpha-induced protein 2 [Larimichthys crocea]
MPMNAGGTKQNQEGEKKRLLKLKNPVKLWKNRRQQNTTRTEEDVLDSGEAVQQENEEQLEEVSRRLIIREEQLFSQDSPNEEEEDQLQRDFEALRLQIRMAIQNTFTSSSSSSTTLAQLEVLRSAAASIQQLEEQDLRWMGCVEGRVPGWRPQKCLSAHNSLLQNVVESRLMKTAEEDQNGPDGLSSDLKREVCRLGIRVKDDLLSVVRMVKDCYPPQIDILNLYAGLYHQSFSARLTELAGSGLETDDCHYLLLWINHYYPQNILKHEDLEGKINTACLGSLLLEDRLDQLEDQYLTHKEDTVKLWLNTALKKEEESWLSGKKPELIDQYCFSPLAIEVIRVIDGSLTEFSPVIRDQSKAQRITVHLESFLSSYKKCVEEFVKGDHSNIRLVVKAHLVCEEQFRNYITGQTGSLSEQQIRRCLETLSALRDCGCRCFIDPIYNELKECLHDLWTSNWLKGSLPVIDSLLDSLNQELTDLSDLKPSCRQSVLGILHEVVVIKYVKKMMNTKKKMDQQMAAQRITEDAQKINSFFEDKDCTQSLWLSQMLCSLAEILRLQDPESVQLEIISVARAFPDLGDDHVTALLSLKSGLTAANIRLIRQSVKANGTLDASTNHSPLFFSKVKVQRINNMIKQMRLKT